MKSQQKSLVLFVALLTACSQSIPTVRADTPRELSYEYIDLLYQLDDLYDEMDVLEEMLPYHEQYLIDLEAAMCLLQIELMTNPHTAAEQDAIFAQLHSLSLDYGQMSDAIDDINDDIYDKWEEIDAVEYRMAEIEYELAGL